MIVCVCNAIREKDLREAARDGGERPCDVYARLGRKPKCGQCLPFARDIINMKAASA
jgi:bacterioferritin-associated ferredoxin